MELFGKVLLYLYLVGAVAILFGYIREWANDRLPAEILALLLSLVFWPLLVVVMLVEVIKDKRWSSK